MFRKIYERLTDKEPILIGTEQINIKPLIKSLPVMLTAGILGFYAGKITEAIKVQWNPQSLVQNLSKEQLMVLRNATIKALQDKWAKLESGNPIPDQANEFLKRYSQ